MSKEQVIKLTNKLLKLAATNHPQEFQNAFIGLMANVIGNMPEPYWKEFRKLLPCNKAHCDCHTRLKGLINQLGNLRDAFKAFEKTGKAFEKSRTE